MQVKPQSAASHFIIFSATRGRFAGMNVVWLQYQLTCSLFFVKDVSQVCKSDQRPSTLPVGPVVTVMGSLQTPTPNSTGESPLHFSSQLNI